MRLKPEPASHPVARWLARFFRRKGLRAKARTGVVTVTFGKVKR